MSRRAPSLSRELPMAAALLGTLVLVAAWLLMEPTGSVDVSGAPGLASTAEVDEPLVPESASVELERREVVTPDWSEDIEGFDVEVFVVDERGLPVAGATVDVFAERIDVALMRRRDAGEVVDASFVPTSSSVTDAAGEVSLRSVPANARVVAREGDRISLARFARDFASEGWGALTLAAGQPLNVQVVDRHERPVANAVVGVDFSTFEAAIDEPWAYGARRTDAEGRVALLVSPGMFGLVATIGEARTETAWVSVDDRADVTLHVPGVASVEGVVFGRDHAAPIAGARVYVVLRTAVRPSGVDRIEFRRVVRSDDDGAFRVAVPRLGVYDFAVTADEWGTSAPRRLSLTSQDDPRVVDVVLDRLTTIAGKAVDMDSAPVTEGGVVATWVSHQPRSLGLDLDPLVADLDDRGFFTLRDVEPTGVYTITHEPPPERASLDEVQRGELTTTPGVADAVLVVPGGRLIVMPGASWSSTKRLGPASARLEVRSSNGELLKRVLLASELLYEGEWRRNSSRRISNAGEDGLHHVLGLDEGGTYRFTLIADGHTSVQTAECFPSTDSPIVRVDVPRASRLSVSVTRDGEPAPFASVTLAMRDVSRSWRPRRAGKNGHATFENLHPGVYTLIARQASATSELREVTLVPDMDMDIELPLDG